MYFLTEINFPLSNPLYLMYQSIHKVCQAQIAPIAQKIDQENEFPRHLWPELGKLGAFGIIVDKEYGGLGLGYLAQALAMQAISCASAAVGLSYGAHANLCINQIHSHGTLQQKKQYLPKLVSGEHVGALAMSEANSGSDIISMQLTATKSGSNYILNGTKMWITNGPDADVIVVYAKTEPQAKAKGITAFIVPGDTPGLERRQKLDKLGMRGSNTCELVFNNVSLDESHLLGTLNQGIKILMAGLDFERVILAAGSVGIMQTALQEVIPYLHERKQFNQPIGEFQLMQGKLADMYTMYNSSKHYLYSMAHACDQGKITKHDAASVILLCAEQATNMALQAIQCFGGNGYMNEYAVSRLLRDAKLYEIGAGTSEIRRMLIGRELFQQSS